MRRSTRTTGRSFLEIVLPDEVDPERVEATIDDGVLTIRVSKRAADQAGPAGSSSAKLRAIGKPRIGDRRPAAGFHSLRRA